MTIKRLLSFDVGIKNLAFCYAETTLTKTTILDWSNLCVTDLNCKKIKLDELCEELLQTLNENFNDSFEADIVLIENQPSMKNGLMKTVSVMVYTYFNMMKLQYGNIQEVKFISASNKLKCKKVSEIDNALKETYKDRKKLSIEVVKKYIEVICPERMEWFMKLKKKDDAADNALQMIYYIETILKYTFVS